MQTKENQWRLLNTLALHEISAQEREACQVLGHLSARLDALTQAVAALEGVVAECRARTRRERYAEAVAPFVGRAVAKLAEAMPAYLRAVDAIGEGGVAIVGGVVEGEGLGGELERFRGVAQGFRERVEGVDELMGVCEALEELALVVGGVGEGVLGAAESVLTGAEVAEVGRVALARKVVEMRDGAPWGASFVE